MGCFSGCLMSSAGIQNLFCGIYSAFKCSFDEFVGEKVVSLSYSSTNLGLPPQVDSLPSEPQGKTSLGEENLLFPVGEILSTGPSSILSSVNSRISSYQ